MLHGLGAELEGSLAKLTQGELKLLLSKTKEALEQGSPATGALDAAHISCLRCLDLDSQHATLCETQVALELSQAAYFDLFDQAPIAYCRLNASGVVTRANAAAQRMTGLRSTLVGQALSRLMAPHEQLAFMRQLRYGPWHGAPRVFECNHFGRRAEASHVDVSVSREATLDEKGEQGLKVVLIDVTRRRAIEQDLRVLSDVSQVLGASLDYLQTVPAALARVASHRTPLCFVDLQQGAGPVTRLHAPQNGGDAEAQLAQVESLYALGASATPQAQVIRTGAPLIAGSFAARADEGGRGSGFPSAVLPLIAHRKVLGCLTLVLGPDEEPYEGAELQTAFALADRIAMAVYTGQAHRDAQQAVRERQVVLGTVAHDLKNILLAILLRAESLAKADNARAANAVSAIARSATRMDRMLEDLMDIASIDRGQLSLRPAEQVPQWVLEEAVESCRGAAEARGIAVQVDAGPQEVMFCDGDRCVQVLVNLIGNAVKFSGPGSRVLVRQRVEGAHHVLFSVQDTGPGLSPESLSRVFDNFWRVAGQRAKGRGLGLTICRGIVEGSGGKIWVESVLGQGSTFYFTVPLAQNPAKRVSSTSADTVLVVDDDEDLRSAASEVLLDAGYKVLEARNGQEALSLVRATHQPYLVLLDLDMPVMNGWRFLEERARCEVLHGLNVLVLSGEKQAETDVLASGAGFLLKPVTSSTLLKGVRQRMEPPPEPGA